MSNLLLLLVLTCTAKAAWYEGNPDSCNPKLIGGGGGNRQESQRNRASLQTLAIPTNPPVQNPNISIGMNQNRIEIVDLRGRIEAQNIDIGPDRSWFERFIAWVSTWCGSRPRPLTPVRAPTPPRLFRTASIYPGR